MEDIDRAIEYCTSFDPDFPNKIRGASSELIEAVERASGRPASAEHRRFLERLGGGETAWLEFAPLQFSAQALFYSHERTEGPIPEGYELVALNDDESMLDMYFVDSAAGRRLEFLNTRDGCSYSTLAEDSGLPAATSLTEYIGLLVLRQKVVSQLPLQETLCPIDNSTKAALADFRRVALARGFVPLWFSDWRPPRSMTVAMERQGYVVIAQQPPGYPIVVTVAGSYPIEFANLLEILIRQLNLRLP